MIDHTLHKAVIAQPCAQNGDTCEHEGCDAPAKWFIYQGLLILDGKYACDAHLAEIMDTWVERQRT